MEKTNPRAEIRFNGLSAGQPIDRRDFLKKVGGGIVIVFAIGIPAADAKTRQK